MRLFFLLDSPYPNYTGGRETWITNVCNRLCHNYDIFIFSYKNKKISVGDGVIKNIDPRITIIQTELLQNNNAIEKISRSYLNYFFYKKNTQHMKSVIETQLNDSKTIIISMNSIYLAKIANKIRDRHDNVIHICSLRGKHGEIAAGYYPLLTKMIYKEEYQGLANADEIWFNGYDTEAYYQKMNINGYVIFNGADIKKIIKMNKEDLEEKFLNIHPKAVTIGTLLDLKGYPEMIRAIAQLKNKYNKNLHLFVFGKGNQQSYKILAEQLNVQDLIHFEGQMQEAVRYCKGAELCLAFGTNEGAGLSMAGLEMLASGCPVIFSKIPCYLQMAKENESAFFVEEKNFLLLAEKMNYILTHSDYAKKIGHKGQEASKKFDWDNVISQIEARINCYA